jgi:hypothetical protein
MDKPIKWYIQDLMIGTENAERNLCTEILIALAHTIYHKSKTQTLQTFYTKDTHVQYSKFIANNK